MMAFFGGLGSILKSFLTGPDGESFAPGRIMGFAVFFVGQWVAVFSTIKVAPLCHTPGDWQTYFIGFAGLQVATVTAAVGAILGQAPTDAGGKWWSRSASPPPPVESGKPPSAEVKP